MRQPAARTCAARLTAYCACGAASVSSASQRTATTAVFTVHATARQTRTPQLSTTYRLSSEPGA